MSNKRTDSDPLHDGYLYNGEEGRRGTLPSRNQSAIITPGEPEPLSKPERTKLHMLGYKNEHIDELPIAQARQAIATKAYRPGSDAYIKHAPNPLTGTPGIPEAARFSDEAIENRNAARPEPSGVEIRIDEFTHKCIRGEDPLDATLLECQEAYPDSVVRLINPDLPPISGTAPQQIYRENGTAVEIAGLKAMRWPIEVYNREFRQPNLKRSQTMAGQAPRAPGDVVNEAIPEGEARYVPLEGKGLQIERNLNTF